METIEKPAYELPKVFGQLTASLYITVYDEVLAKVMSVFVVAADIFFICRWKNSLLREIPFGLIYLIVFVILFIWSQHQVCQKFLCCHTSKYFFATSISPTPHHLGRTFLGHIILKLDLKLLLLTRKSFVENKYSRLLRGDQINVVGASKNCSILSTLSILSW